MNQFSGKVAIITGASGLLASGVIPVFRAGGAKLALTCGDDRLYERMPDLRDDPHHLCSQSADLSEPAVVDDLVARALAEWGRIDILVNIVGGWDAGKPVHEMTVDTWETMIRLNSTITFLMCRAVIPAMLDGGGGAIVNIGARPGLRSSGNDAAYAASKAAALRLTESLSEEYKRRRDSRQRRLAICDCHGPSNMPKIRILVWTPEQAGPRDRLSLFRTRAPSSRAR